MSLVDTIYEFSLKRCRENMCSPALLSFTALLNFARQLLPPFVRTFEHLLGRQSLRCSLLVIASETIRSWEGRSSTSHGGASRTVQPFCYEVTQCQPFVRSALSSVVQYSDQ
jgi:hypothetical protein